MYGAFDITLTSEQRDYIYSDTILQSLKIMRTFEAC